MVNKIITSLILGIFLISFTSALTFDDLNLQENLRETKFTYAYDNGEIKTYDYPTETDFCTGRLNYFNDSNCSRERYEEMILGRAIREIDAYQPFSQNDSRTRLVQPTETRNPFMKLLSMINDLFNRLFKQQQEMNSMKREMCNQNSSIGWC